LVSVPNQTDNVSSDPLDGMDAHSSREPQAMYAMLRQHLPVLRKEGAGVIVSRRGDVLDEVLRNPELFSSGIGAAELGNIRPLIPLQIDPPEHRKFRKLLDPLFSPRQVRVLEESVTNLVDELMDSFEGSGEIDFVEQFSLPFPSQVFLTMMGLPLEDLPKLLAMKDGIIRPHLKLGTSVRHPDADAMREQTGQSIYAYFEEVLDKCEPGGTDLLGAFLAAEVDGDRLTRNDILDICFLFIIAGLDTVSASLDCFFRYLAEHPDRRAEIVADPTIIPDVVEELLRWETPVMTVSRIATHDTVVAGCPISAGETVLPILGSANTDDEGFTDAGSVLWGRGSNTHHAFGVGIHRCLGSHLARLELRVALRVWHSRIPHYRTKPGVDLVHTAGVRSLETFPMLLGTSA
jgi:cytochrome P450